MGGYRVWKILFRNDGPGFEKRWAGLKKGRVQNFNENR
jgi:hypothetical protein